MIKRMTLVLALAGASSILALPSLGSEPDGKGPFVDVDGSVHESDVASLWEAGITTGCAEWLYCPEEEVTREQVAAFLVRALELSRADGATFSDTDTSQFAAEIEALAAADITVGCAEGRYCPDRPLTRGQMASLLARALDLPDADTDSFFDDEGNVHEGSIDDLAEAAIAHGCAEDRFCPERPVTRQQMASFLARALDLEPPAELPEIPAQVLEEVNEPEWPTGPGAEGWRPLVEEYFPASEVDRAIRIIACESNGNPRARNSRSGASGLFQHMPGDWSKRASAAGFPGASIYDPEANVAAAAWLAYEAQGGGWQHWVCK